jgi:hypothetical protein
MSVTRVQLVGNVSGDAVFNNDVGIGTTNPTSKLHIVGNTLVTGVSTATSIVVGSGGTAGAPSLTFTGDLNTGIFSPSADTIAFSEGGVERARIDSAGRVLVGTEATSRSVLLATNDSVSSNAGIEIFRAVPNSNPLNAGLVITVNPANNDGQSGLVLAKTNGNANGSFTAVLPGTLGSVVFAGADGSSLRPAAQITGVGGTPDSGISPGSLPGQLTFSTTDVGDTTPTERMRIDSSGRLLVGTSSDVGGGDLIQSDTSIASFRANTTAGNSPILKLLRSRGSTFSLSDAVLNNDSVGRILFQAVDGSSLISAAQIAAEVDGTPGANDMPGRLVFSTTADGASSPTERMRIHSDGNVSIGITTNTGDKLYVNGTIRSNGQIQTLIGDTDTAPGYTWQGDEDTGMFRTGADSLGFSAGGSEIARFNFGGTSGRRQLYFEGTAEVWSAGSLYLEGVTSVRSATIKDATTASGGNVVINASSGLLQRSTSSVKYKTEVENAELSYSEALVYGSRPVWYRSLSENDPSEYSYWGFIAEEVAEIDPRMVHWGDDGPEGVQYDRYVVHLVSVIQKQQQRLDVLEARIAALEA